VAQVDTRERQLTIKLVYYGPPLSGKTTNLRYIHGQVDELNRGRLMTLDTRDDRTLFFDLLPIFFKTSGLSFRVKVYTVPGQPMHEATRRIVLQGADGIAFVADAQRSEIRANNEAYQNLLTSMSELGLARSKVPIVVQFNKCDLPEIVGEEEIREWGETEQEPTFRSCALRGDGVLETFFGLLQETWRSLDQSMNLGKLFATDEAAFMGAVRSHLDLAAAGSQGAENG
jgi:signal recognition particle receptor subunit beta